MQSSPPVPWWMAASALTQACLVAAVFTIFGAAERGTDIALQVTARLSFLLFLLAYTGGPLAALFGSRFDALRGHGRELGLAFAAAQSVHLCVVMWLCWIGHTPKTGVFVFFGFALFWMYSLALFSIETVRRRAGAAAWWAVRRVGMNYIMYAFATDFLRYPFSGGLKHIVEYAPFAILSVAGVALYGCALVLNTVRPYLLEGQRITGPATNARP